MGAARHLEPTDSSSWVSSHLFSLTSKLKQKTIHQPWHFQAYRVQNPTTQVGSSEFWPVLCHSVPAYIEEVIGTACPFRTFIYDPSKFIGAVNKQLKLVKSTIRHGVQRHQIEVLHAEEKVVHLQDPGEACHLTEALIEQEQALQVAEHASIFLFKQDQKVLEYGKYEMCHGYYLCGCSMMLLNK